MTNESRGHRDGEKAVVSAKEEAVVPTQVGTFVCTNSDPDFHRDDEWAVQASHQL
jgi:hypothetical protein